MAQNDSRAVDRLRATLFPPERPGVKNFKVDAGPNGDPESIAQGVLDALNELTARETAGSNEALASGLGDWA